MQSLAEREADLKGLRKIDIGGGLYPRKGYETVDIKNGNIEADLNKKWPFKDGEVGVINASHILEHLVDKQHSMSEIHRVLAHGGYAFIDVPSTDGRGAFQDPTHISYWNENSFLYYTTSQLGQFIYNDTIRFQQLDLRTYYPNDWMKKHKVLVTRAWLRCMKKADRDRDFPGEINI
jgi:SAM-dependent methyltransferase